MKTIPARRIREVLRSVFGLRPAPQGDGTGHEVWRDATGRCCRPVLRKCDVAYAIAFSLGSEMEAKGIATRRAFLAALRG